MKAHRFVMRLTLALAALGLAGAAGADRTNMKSLDGQPAQAECHPMMMAAECIRFKTTLAALPEGERKERYLTEIRTEMEDRNSACDCARHQPEVVIQPRRRAALARY